MTNHTHSSKDTFTKLEGLERNTAAKAEALIHDLASKSGKISSDIQEYTDATTQYIRRNPVKSTLIAGVAGLILGKLLSK